MVIQIHCIGCGRKSPIQRDPSILCEVCCTLPEYKYYHRRYIGIVSGTINQDDPETEWKSASPKEFP